MILRSFILVAFVRSGFGSGTCKYINQDTSSVVVDTNVNVAASNGGTEMLTINEGDSISIRCTDSSKKAFEYGLQTTYTCPTGGSSRDSNLPICVDKCTKLVDINDPNSTFLDGTDDVSNTALPALTPVAIQCTVPFAQMFAQLSNQKCESWNSAALCKKMCELSSYDTTYTEVESTGITVATGVKYLKVGYSISITCRGGYALPAGAVSSVKCDEADNGKLITIPSCLEVCKVPAQPEHTTYHTLKERLNEGEVFTVSCADGYKLPYYTKSKEVACKNDGTFEEIPQCKETCSISAGGDSTVLNKTVTGNLAQDEAVKVTCKNPSWLLPYGNPTPWVIVCENQQNFNIPACQQTCTVPTAPPNADLVRVGTGTSLSLREPIKAQCKSYYKYETGSDVEEFLCLESESGALVDIDKFCYVYAKLSHKSGGTHKVSLTGEIVDGKDHASDGTTIVLQITGSNTDITKSGIVPNVAVEVDVGVYEPLSVNVQTTSVVDGVNRVITQSNADIYPGPPSPKIEQEKSTSDTIEIKLAQSGDPLFDSIPDNQVIKHTISYTNKGSPFFIDVTDSNSPVILPNLDSASAYTVSITTTLNDTYGGLGSPSSYTVYTGPSPVADLIFTVRETDAEISWSKITDATRYDVSIFDDGSKLVSKSTAGLSVSIIDLSPGKTYLVTIVTGRNVAKDGKDVEFLGGVFSDNMESAPLSPDSSLFEVSNTSSSVNIKKVSKASVKRQAEALDYVVFLNDVKYAFPAAAEEVTLPDLKLSTVYEVQISEAVGTDGYGMKTTLTRITTADCGSLICNNCVEGTDALFAYVRKSTTVSVKCIDEYTITQRNEEGKIDQVEGMSLFCNNKNQYLIPDRNLIYVGPIECTKQEAVVAPVKSYTIYYYIGGGILVLLLIIIVILILVFRRRRIQGTYNAKKVNETSKNGTISPTHTPRSFVHENAYFENKMDMELMRNQSARSKTTSYGSQELRMEIADSDSGITEDLDTYFNPAVLNSRYEEDNVSTKSALV